MFGTPEQYPKALNIIALSTFVVLGVSSFIFLRYEPAMARGPMFELPIIKLQMPFIWVGGIMVVSILFRIVKLHDRISDLLSIREKYDVNEIISPIFSNVMPQSKLPERDALILHRRTLMKRIFYRYAPGPPGKNAISDHLVAMAWESLCLYWIVTEAAFVLAVFTICSALLALTNASLIFLALFSVSFSLCFVAIAQCKKQTKEEIEAILDNDDRKHEIRSVFNEIFH
jgi:hypothetical protein